MNYLFPFLTVVIWSGNAIVNKLAVETIEPTAMSFYRWFFAVLILTPFCLPSVIRDWKTIRPYTMKLVALAALGMVLNQSLGYFAAVTTSASNMALITSLVPLLAVFFSLPLLGKKISMLSIVGAVISLAGLAFMLGHGDILFLFHNAATVGDGLMVLAALVYALYCVLIKRWTMPLTNWQFVYMQGVFAVAMLCPVWLTSDNIIPPAESAHLIAYAAVGASVIAPFLWVKAIDRIGADGAAMFMNLLPVITILFAAQLLDETITVFHLVGGLMVITGVMLSQIKLSKKTTATNSEAFNPNS
ncbi:DMT family transporter [Vibrio sp. SCSIO 43136]|uniref:DMT family transporter n=1 Tax=Vibrio sp. SCSIO 43136 TaxID=2819101 RepID=UPI002075282F|nr:DMT family transporter [Vibrio sp. SCSIO 43136]USD68070.1 DMT family transporter [Vibrio sp. SCSIO 43136]